MTDSLQAALKELEALPDLEGWTLGKYCASGATFYSCQAIFPLQGALAATYARGECAALAFPSGVGDSPLAAVLACIEFCKQPPWEPPSVEEYGPLFAIDDPKRLP